MAHSRLPRLSLKTKLLLLLGGVTIVSISTVGVLSITSIIQTSQTAQEVAGATLNAQVEEFMTDIIVKSAELTDHDFAGIRDDVARLQSYAVEVFSSPRKFPGSAYWKASEHLRRGPEGQLINDEADVSAVFAPSFVELNNAIITELEQMALLDPLIAPLVDGNPMIAAGYAISVTELMRVYPNEDLASVMDPHESIIIESVYGLIRPENNPSLSVLWSPIYEDISGGDLTISAMAPVVTKSGAFYGQVGVDVTLAELTDAFETDEGPVAGGYWLLINQEGKALAMPPSAYSDILGRPREDGEFGTDLTKEKSSFSPILADMMDQNRGFRSIAFAGEDHFVAYAPISSVDWSLAYIVESESLTKAVTDLQAELDRSTTALIWQRIVPAALLILVLALAMGFWYMARLTGPIEALSVAANNLGAGKWDQELPPAGEDEIGVLSKAFGAMAAEIRSMMEGLEQKVAERTKELRQANRTLEELAEKLSKYLSPQIYQSIFSGETDVTVSTNRKKLTVFFSDIKDFTATTEDLQPEDLTFILNDYFTAMSAIVREHGGTLDKFIGDAIVVFFGDPTSKGVKEDAAACVRMAIEMQQQMHILRRKWEGLGYEKPLHMRVGINTGYCNVGNFGSDDRLDYTIIGGEVNLAARLEGITEPDGVTMSYETYVNVKDFVHAEEQEAIKVKGIRRDVRPFKVVGLFDELAEDGEYVHRRRPGLSITIDLNKLSPDEARQELTEAMQALDRSGVKK